MARAKTLQDAGVRQSTYNLLNKIRKHLNYCHQAAQQSDVTRGDFGPDGTSYDNYDPIYSLAEIACHKRVDFKTRLAATIELNSYIRAPFKKIEGVNASPVQFLIGGNDDPDENEVRQVEREGGQVWETESFTVQPSRR